MRWKKPPRSTAPTEPADARRRSGARNPASAQRREPAALTPPPPIRPSAAPARRPFMAETGDGIALKDGQPAAYNPGQSMRRRLRRYPPGVGRRNITRRARIAPHSPGEGFIP